MHTMDVVYITCLSIGVLYALVAFLAGHMHLPHVQFGQDGSAGHVGDVGHIGDVGGHVGHVGDIGHVGHVGDVGHTGHVGDAGHAGHVGDTGHTGHGGDSGHAGHAGDTGHAPGQGDHGTAQEQSHANATRFLSFISPITVSTFLTGFGAAGIVTSMGLGLPAVINVPVSFVTATGIAYAGYSLFIRYFIESQSSSESIVAELVGSPAKVMVTIAPDCIGAITYTDVGRRYSMPARAAEGQSFDKGAQVFILRVEGGVAQVWQGQSEVEESGSSIVN